MRRDCSSAAAGPLGMTTRQSQERRPRHDAARAHGRRRRSSSATRGRRTRRCAGSRAGSRRAKRPRCSRWPARRACRGCSRSTGPSCAAAICQACRSTKLPPRSRAYFVDALQRAAPPASRRRRAQRSREGSELARHAARPARSSTSSSRRPLVLRSGTRTARFRRRAYEDLRHLLKHKRTYQPHALTARQLRVLARATLTDPAVARARQAVYHFVTRVVLGWPERAGPLERRG